MSSKRMEQMLMKLNSEETKLDRLHPSVLRSHRITGSYLRLETSSYTLGSRLSTPRLSLMQKFFTNRFTRFRLTIFLSMGMSRLTIMSVSRGIMRTLVELSEGIRLRLGIMESSRLYFYRMRGIHPGEDYSSELPRRTSSDYISKSEYRPRIINPVCHIFHILMFLPPDPRNSRSLLSLLLN